MDPLSSPLSTDLYQLTMLQAYFESGMDRTAVFELFARKLPENRNFLLAAGLEQALAFLESLRFRESELEWVEGSGLFRPGFAERLEKLRFTGEVHAMPEGTPFFPSEPVLRVTAPLPEAQLVETRLVNIINYQTMVASKAARSVLAGRGKGLVDFGLRRAHGAEAGLHAARASYLAGFAGTATVIAGAEYGIPVFGTMAHSYVQAHEDEIAAFEHFARVFPRSAMLLIDTYDTIEAARKVVALGRRLRLAGIAVKGVRLDSGDLGALAREVRSILDSGGLAEAIIFASGDLDEWRVAELVDSGAPIDSFGIGTRMVTSHDAPSLDFVYKLQEYAGEPRRKRSTGKATWPGRKQVFRSYAPQGTLAGDTLALESERVAGEPLLHPVMREGRVLRRVQLASARAHAADQLSRLPPRLRDLEPCDPPYPVEISAALQALAAQVDRRTGAPLTLEPT